jgi:hypothetical protein
MPGPDGVRPGLARRLRRALTERLHFKLAALFFSCVLWLVVSAEEPTEQVVQIVVAPRLDSSLVLVGRRPVVRALVVGRARELLELAGDPPVARPFVSLARSLVHSGDSIQLAVVPADVEIPTNVQVLVREIRPRTVTIQVARVSRPLPPATAAESALAGLSAPRMRADTGQALRDTVGLDTLAVPDSGRTDSSRTLRARGVGPDSARIPPPPRP